MADEPVAITKAPTVAVTNLAPPTFDGDYYFEVEWSVPSVANDDQRDDRFEGIKVQFIWSATGEGTDRNGKATYTNVDAILSAGNLPHTGVQATNTDPLNRTQDVAADATSVGYYFDKYAFYPVYSPYDAGRNYATLYANSLTVRVWGWNSHGNGPKVETVYYFARPRSLSNAQYSEKGFSEASITDNVITRSVEMYNGNDSAQRVDARLRLLRERLQISETRGPRVEVYNSSYQDRIRPAPDPDLNTLTAVYTDNEMYTLTQSECIFYQWVLDQRGYHGPSISTINYFVRWPPKPTITKLSYSHSNIYANLYDGYVKISCKAEYADKSVNRWIDQYSKTKTEPDVLYQLQICKDTSVHGQWTDVGDPSRITSAGFTDVYTNAVNTTRGHRTWYRIKATRDGFANYVLYSEPVEAKKFYYETVDVSTFEVTIASAKSDSDGRGVTLDLEWSTADEPDDVKDHGVEVSWSSFERAWESNEPPSTLNVTWDVQNGSTRSNRKATASIRGLEEGTAYYIRARRYADVGEGTEYGPYTYLTEGTTVNTITPVSSIENLILNVESYKKIGDDLYFSWGYDSGSIQTAWQLEYGNGHNIIASGTDSRTYATIPWSTISKLIRNTNSHAFYFRVSMTVGSDWSISSSKKVTYLEPPTVEVSIPSSHYVSKSTKKDITSYVIEKQPLRFVISCACNRALLTVNVVSQGNGVSEPDGYSPQPSGEIVWSNSYTYGSSAMTKDAPRIAGLRNKCKYYLEVTAVDPSLESNTASARIEITPNWNVESWAPAYNSSVEVYTANKTVGIIARKSANADASDTVEIYRITPDGPVKILENGKFGVRYIDRYAPYSNHANLSYRIAARTIYRDVEWIDVPYELSPAIGWNRGEPFYTMSFDWGEKRHLEVPYNLEFQDGYAKNFEAKMNLDGTITGWWNSAVNKTKTLKTVATKFSNPEQIELIRELAQYAGPVFVRTPDGDAFEADVQVTSLDNKYDGLTISVSFKATALTLTDEFKM